MENKTKVMVSLGSAYAASCIPCFDHYYELAIREKISDDDINEIIAIAKKVRNGSDIALEKAISDLVKGNEGYTKMDDGAHPCKCC